MHWATLLLAFGLAAPMFGRDRIAYIEFFGYRGIDAEAVRKALPFRQGDAIPGCSGQREAGGRLTESFELPTLKVHRLAGLTTMTVTLKPKMEIMVPKSIRRQAGFKPGDRVEFRVSGRTINIIPKLSPDELQDEREIRDPKIRALIRKSHEEFLAGKSRPIQELFAERAARTAGRRRRGA